MGNANREAGDRFERQVKAVLGELGWWTIRAAGSHGIADVVALQDGRKPLLVSCKINGRVSPAERLELAEAALRAGARAILASRPRRGRILLAVVLPGGKRIVNVDELPVPSTHKEGAEIL